MKITAGNRYFEDQSGTPFLLNGEAAWSLMAQLPYTQANLYLTDRKNRGFNGILVSLIEHQFADNAPANANNDLPFTGASFVTPNNNYFTHVDSVINRANQLGMVVFLCPIYLGYNCGQEGWCSEVQSASAADLRTWGEYVGNRYKNYPNIIWVIGGDMDPTAYSAVQAKVDSMVSGLKATDTLYPNRLITTHSERETEAFTHWPESWVTLNNIYASHGSVISLANSAYDRSPAQPFFLIEGFYENEHGMTAQQLRAQAYWTVLRGGSGHIFGNCPTWAFGSKTSAFCSGTDWQSALSGNGSVSMTYFANLFTARHWNKLVPDRNNSVLTSGAGSGDDVATIAYTTDSSSIIGYLPSNRSVTIDPSVLRGDSIHVYWYNPSNGTAVDAGLYTNASRSYNQPSSGDWVLLIDGKGFNFNPPGNIVVIVAPPAFSTIERIIISFGIVVLILVIRQVYKRQNRIKSL